MSQLPSPLLPCPFCGSDAEWNEIEEELCKPTLKLYSSVYCSSEDCGASIDGYWKEGDFVETADEYRAYLRAKWNQRS